MTIVFELIVKLKTILMASHYSNTFCTIFAVNAVSMAPNVTSPTSMFLAEAEVISQPRKLTPKEPLRPPPQSKALGPKSEYHWQIVWRNVIAFIYLHSVSVYGFYLIFLGKVHLYTVLFGE